MFNRTRCGLLSCVRGAFIAAAVALCGSAAGDIVQNPLFQGSSLEVSVALSDGDQLTFRAAGPGGTGMFGFQPSSPPIFGGTILTIRGDAFASPEMSPPSMSSTGGVAFTDIDADGRSAMFASGPGGNIITIRGENFGSFARASMGFHGTIYGDFRSSSGHASLLAYPPGGQHITIVGEAFGASSFGRTRSTVEGGAFAQVGRLGTANDGEILSIAPGGSIITIVGRDRFDNIQGPAVSGELAVFSGVEQSSGLAGVFAQAPGGVLITVYGENFLVPTLFTEPAANDAGAVVFGRLGPVNGGVERIYYTDLHGSPLLTLAAIGDELLGSTITSLTFNADGLNQAGEFGYGAQLADGRSVIMMASGVPAPDAAAMVGIGAALWSRRRRR